MLVAGGVQPPNEVGVIPTALRATAHGEFVSSWTSSTIAALAAWAQVPVVTSSANADDGGGGGGQGGGGGGGGYGGLGGGGGGEGLAHVPVPGQSFGMRCAPHSVCNDRSSGSYPGLDPLQKLWTEWQTVRGSMVPAAARQNSETRLARRCAGPWGVTHLHTRPC